jgi:hypothetical protein
VHQVNLRERLLALFDSMGADQQRGVVMAAEASRFYATLRAATPEEAEARPPAPHAECVGAALQKLGTPAPDVGWRDGWNLARTCLEDMRLGAPSLLDQVKDVYCEGLRAGMALGAKMGAGGKDKPAVEVGWRGPTDRQAAVLEAADRWRKWMLDVDPNSVMSISAASRNLVEAVDGLMLPDREGRCPMTPDQERVLRAAAQWWQHHHLETLILDCDQELRAAVSQLVRRGKVTPGLEKVDDATERSRWERAVRVVRAAQAVRNHIRYSGLDRLLDGAAPQELCAAVEVLQPGDVTE